MQWWNDFVDWFNSDDGRGVFLNVILPFVAIVVAGLVAAWIGRWSTRRLIALNDRENRVSAVATLIGAARRASVWNTLSAPEQRHADHVASEADVRIRLLAVPGAGLAADWANHELTAMKKNSVSFSFQAEQSLIEFRERMITWQARPNRAKKLFKNDLDLWAYEDSQTKNDIVSQQQAWAAAQVATETGSNATITPAQVVPASTTAPAAAPPAAPAAAAAQPVAFPATEPKAQQSDAGDSSEPAPVPTETAHNETSDDLDDRDSGEAPHSPPVAVNTVTKRINPPLVRDENYSY